MARKYALSAMVLLLLGVMCAGLLGRANEPWPIRRQPQPTAPRLPDASGTYPTDASAAEVKRLYHRGLAEFIPTSKVKEVVVPWCSRNLRDEQIREALSSAVIVRYEDLQPVHLLPDTPITVGMEDGSSFMLTLFSQVIPDNRGRVVLADGKRYWFALLGRSLSQSPAGHPNRDTLGFLTRQHGCFGTQRTWTTSLRCSSPQG
ncbi:MAG: hypothetical protein HY319_04940 [Armatimonadetes bacterium]|nr:hypothetical protein [Armatimonadota bacterium]